MMTPEAVTKLENFSVPVLLNLFKAVSLLLELISPCYTKGSVNRYDQYKGLTKGIASNPLLVSLYTTASSAVIPPT